MPADKLSLAALHGTRLDRAGAVMHMLIDAAEHLTVSTLQLQSAALDRFAERSDSCGHPPAAMIAIDLAIDPELAALGADVLEERIQIAAAVGARWIEFGRWHRHGVNAFLGCWFGRSEGTDRMRQGGAR